MIDSLYLLIPLGSAIIYSFSAILIKQAILGGIGPWRLTFMGNVFSALFICPLIFLTDDLPTREIFLYAAPCGALFVLGMVLTTYSLVRGDVSVATPILGTKVVLVAFFTLVIIGQNPSFLIWIAAILTTLGIALMHLQFGPKDKHLMSTVILSILTAISFAALDVLIQKYSRQFGGLVFVSCTFASMFLFSLLLIPLFSKSFLDITPITRRSFYLGSVLMGFQALGMALAIGLFGQATSVNVVYSSRGIWAVLIVWALGHLFQNEEKRAGTKTMMARLIGATLIVIAIVLVV